MKRIAMLVLAAAITFTMAAPAKAVEVNVKGDFHFGFVALDDTTFTKRNEDDFFAWNRVRTQIEFVASENLKGVLYFTTGNIVWGRSNGNVGKATPAGNPRSNGGALDTDGQNIFTRYAYIEWKVPGTALQVNMGLLPVVLPAAVAGSPVLNATAAGVATSYKFNNNVGLTFGWYRPYDLNDTAPSVAQQKDNADLFVATLPLTFDGLAITPYAVYGTFGNSLAFKGTSVANNGSNTALYMGGVAATVSVLDPLVFKADVIYSYLDPDESNAGFEKAEGWFLDFKASYKFSWGTPALTAWWSSGDDADDVADGKYGRLTQLYSSDPTWGPTSMGTFGNAPLAAGSFLTNSGIGTWGLGLSLEDVTFVKDLYHTARVFFYNGTNDNDLIYNAGSYSPFTDGGKVYLTDKDYAWEFNLDSRYVISKGFTTMLQLGYIYLDVDRGSRNYNASNAWRGALVFLYNF